MHTLVKILAVIGGCTVLACGGVVIALIRGVRMRSTNDEDQQTWPR